MAILNRQKVLNPYLLDLDVYDRKNYKGESLTYKDADSVNNAITMYMINKKGSYLYKPNFGSPLDILDFKNLDLLLAGNYSQRISAEIQSNFDRYISNVIVEFVPNYENRLIDVTVRYTSLLNKEIRIINIIKKATIVKYQNEVKYIDVPLEKENLIRWISMEVMNQPKSSLLYEPTIQSWVWSSFKLINLGDAATSTWKTVQSIIFEYNTKVV
jgi:hypothetical protein